MKVYIHQDEKAQLHSVIVSNAGWTCGGLDSSISDDARFESYRLGYGEPLVHWRLATWEEFLEVVSELDQDEIDQFQDGELGGYGVAQTP